MKTFSKSITTALTLLCLLLPVQSAEEGPAKPIPDMTKGEKLTRMNSRLVGPLGIVCGVWRQRQGTDDETPYIRQLLVLEIEKGSPADGVLKVDDVIIGADGTGAAKVPLFKGSEIWPMIPIADAINEAEARDPALLKLLVWRKGVTNTVTIKMDYLGRYSETAPYNCPKSKAILRKGIKALYEENKFDSAGLGILCLLAADDPTNPDNDKYQAKAKEWAHQLEPEGSPWFVGPKLMALSEYYMKTKDETIFPKLVALAEYHAKGVSWFGTCGHRYSEPAPDGSDNGRIAGYGPITASGTLGYLGLSLARQAGVNSPAVEKSHEAQRKFFGHFALKSGMGYGEMPYGIGGGADDYNAKLANSGLSLGMDEGKEKEAKYFSKIATLSSIGRRQYAHGGSFFGQVFHPIGAIQGGVKAAHMQFEEIRWHLDLKRSWDHTRIYDAKGNGYSDHHHGATALIFYAAPLKQIYLTGRGQKESLKFTDAEFQELVEVKNFDASKHINEELLAVMSRYDGMLRGDVADELAARVKANPDASETTALIDQLLGIAADENNSTHARVGACCSLMMIKNRSREPVKSMKNAEIAKTMAGLLKDPEAYIRFAGVRVLQHLDHGSVRPHVNEIMDAIIATDRPTFPLDEEDPMRWAHGEMGVMLYNQALSEGLDGVDRSKLIPAMRSLLQTTNGAARRVSSSILAMLDKEEILALSDLIVDSIQVSSPANAMGGDAQQNSQAALAKFLFKETLPLSMTYGVNDAIKQKIPQKFGRAALGMPSARQVMEAAGEQILVNAVDAQELIDGILTGEAPEELNSLKRIDSITAADPVLKLPAAETKLVVEATNFAVPGEGQTTYTWRKLYGAGRVSFSPNASGQSKATTVSFIDMAPGKYRFEVEMTDKLGLTVVRDTVDVTLNDSSGKLPPNQAPQVKSTSLTAMPGYPVPVTFSGSDPDGDHLGCTVTQLPAHGVLFAADGRRIEAMAAVDGPITYTADFGYEGTDQLTFLALDGQGQSAKGVVEFKVSAAHVPVVVYEGFEYPMGTVHGKEGGSSFGFSGPWVNSRGASDDRYRVLRASLDNPGKTASISYPNLPSREGRLTGGKHASVSRLLDTGLLAKHGMLEPGGELWFSAYVDGADRARFLLEGPNSSFGFEVVSKQRQVLTMLNGEIAGENNQEWSRSADLRFPENEPVLIVGQCVWGETDEEPDTVRIFRVFNAPVFGPMLVHKPAAVMQEAIAQEKLNAILLETEENRAFDEIRIGTSPASVMQGTVPMK